MNVALIIAGGVGSRVGADKPKQFVEVFGRPVLAYTIESFEKHPLIDKIELVCIESWIDEVEKYKDRYGFSKIHEIVKGGSFVQESIFNGIKALSKNLKDDDIVIIHDGVRPLIEEEVITDVITVAKEKGNAVSSLPYNEQIFVIDDEYSTSRYIPRDTLRRVSTPQAYHYGELSDVYHEAFEKEIGIYGSSYTNTLFCDMGRKLYFAKGSDKNIKLTTKDDFKLFRGFLSDKEDSNEVDGKQ